MIFKFFKREPAPAVTAKPKPRRKVKSDTTIPMLPTEPSSLEVKEGSDHQDWALWEDSVAMMDSQLSTLHPSTSRFVDEGEPTEFQDVEAFATVRHKDP